MDLELLQNVNRLRAERRAGIVVTDTSTGSSRLVTEAHVGDDELVDVLRPRFLSGRSGMLEDNTTFLTVHMPPPRLMVIGAVHISQALAPMANIAGFDIRIVDPRTAFATPERFHNVDLVAEWPADVLKSAPLDPYTGLVALTHDPKIDDEPLAAALAAGCFYIGALGSRRTHGARVERLLERGLSGEQIAQIHAPIGFDIGAQSPAEIAVAILAEIISALRKGRIGEGIA